MTKAWRPVSTTRSSQGLLASLEKNRLSGKPLWFNKYMEALGSWLGVLKDHGFTEDAAMLALPHKFIVGFRQAQREKKMLKRAK